VAAAVVTAGAAACALTSSDGGTQSSDPIRGRGQNPTPDAAHPAVVFWSGGCSGTLIAPQVVLTAAPCGSPLANGCSTIESLIVQLPQVTISPSGRQFDPANVTYYVDGLAIGPRAVAQKAAACDTTNGTAGTSNALCALGTLALGNQTVSRGGDIAL